MVPVCSAGSASSWYAETSYGAHPPKGISDKGKALFVKLRPILSAPWNESHRSIVGTAYCFASSATKQSINPEIFRELHEYYVEYCKIEPLAAIHVLKRFLTLADHVEMPNNLFTASASFVASSGCLDLDLHYHRLSEQSFYSLQHVWKTISRTLCHAFVGTCVSGGEYANSSNLTLLSARLSFTD